MTSSPSTGQLTGGKHGQGLVEFAIVLPILMLMLLGILDLGRAVYASHTLGNAARQAARLAITDQTAGAVQAAARDHAVGLDVTVTVSYFLPTPNVNPALNGPCAPVERQCIAVVTVLTDYEAATPVIGGIVGPLTLSATTEMPVEHTNP
jgi:Flp pilus assembly protein TadG